MNNIINPLIFEERWLPVTDKSVKGVKNLYIVSDRGIVLNEITSNQMTLTPTWNGYYRVFLQTDTGGRYYSIHRIVAIEFMPVDNYEVLQVNHIDGNKANNCLWNLEWVTASQNISHAFRNGLKNQYKGEDCSWATITNEQADQIGYMLSQKEMTHKEIADIIGCSVNVVGDISCGNNWKKVYEKYNLKDLKKKFVINFSNDQLHKLFKYFQDHKDIKYKYKADLYRAALKELFDIEMTQSMTATLSRLYNRETRRDISDQYTF